ncbi:S41 family peptidase [Algoriphagus boritolerans]|uniref:Peptidase family S41 n=1 Tax=Algoriphagus boritolerans DSM 17298 = JCM 18970 TaxID=1120964 RepID=A0A1H5WBX4_9BACT|nr:S41 family peptidase [Algoriphagus boritolerans]SEF96972.1 Peptidase family S41 [Algoriphagus boritolerans DSM 17298 = JCM 18970]
MKKLSWIIGLGILIVWGCDPKDDPTPTIPGQEVKQAIFDSMKEWYFWNQELPATVNLANFDSNEALLDGIIFKPLDRFSYLTTQEAFTNAFVGRNAGHGFGFAFTSDEKLFISFVFDESPAGKDGWKRGWEIIQINGKPIAEYKTSSGGYDFKLGPPDPGISNSFTFKLPDGTTTTRTNIKAEYQSNSVLEQKVFDAGGKKVGYWAYQSFKATAGLNPTRSAEVTSSMEFFQSQGIQDLIIDLRYNGGGSVAVAEQISNYLIQSSNSGKLMYTNKLNATKSSQNNSKNFSKIGTLALSRVIFITSRGSASASELVINNLDPYMEVVLIGDNTFGKPVGSFPLSQFNRLLKDNNVEVVPITFATANSEGKAEYFDGFPANFNVGDSPQFEWGDPQDLRLAAALQFVQNGNVSGRMMDTYFKPKWEMIDAFKGLQQEFPSY